VLVLDDAGRMVGVGAGRRRGDQYIFDNFTRPEDCGRGVGTVLLDWSEEVAAGADAGAVRVAVAAHDVGAKALVEARGFGYIRSFYRMAIELDERPGPPTWPEGFTIAPMQPGEERLVHAAIQDAFLDHWDFQPRSFEEWVRHAKIEPALCFLVRDSSGEVVATEYCNEDRFGMGWVDVIGVRRPWRRLGLATALLVLAFAELYDRGRRRIGLGVDAANPTGAVGLYESVGMSPAAQDDAYEKLLRPAG
jgi:ribosomal protein S18 acetylase RimI-like enzyme